MGRIRASLPSLAAQRLLIGRRLLVLARGTLARTGAHNLSLTKCRAAARVGLSREGQLRRAHLEGVDAVAARVAHIDAARIRRDAP